MIRYDIPVMRLALALTALALLTLVGSCGYKDKPVAPSQVVPQPVNDLRYQLSDKGVALTWSYPQETVTGDKVADIAGFDLYRAVVPVEEYCETCPIPFAAPIDLAGGALPDKGQRTASYQMTVLRPGNLYFFKVRSKIGWWSESEDSNIISFLWNSPPMAPEGLRVQPGDGRNMLAWNAVQKHTDGSAVTEPIRYQIIRSVDGGVFAKVGEPLTATSHTDTQVENDRLYAYQVQAVSTFKEGAVPGEVSETVEASPIDRTAPPTPTNVEGLQTGVGVKIFWEHVKAGDLAGYRVYRRTGGQAKPELAGEVTLPYNLFIDTKAPRNTQVFYSVTSIDNRKPANESARTPEVMVVN
jgi:hypothetical protein